MPYLKKKNLRTYKLQTHVVEHAAFPNTSSETKMLLQYQGKQPASPLGAIRAE